ncbi:uncharacterized protein CELE_Y102A5C.2 [Caenorhabditis elegans]|uniref:Uncharacterized protein n=1 Tax=Caenorhabditis elegans TaxID=6239 RepID=Q9XX92_CAEEL|nr:Uncharacterized protein CELE_Y102A5C.2 [Caenorhabditis elegans]CAA20943.2 Uncharacterized protein CELE_Y102A5C.2 [Caenorhabditis elegans]|eukprot:NP_507276.2 Uncharacterized protein CELE_Y102A5C.2 [Caenorhabditis elegans]
MILVMCGCVCTMLYYGFCAPKDTRKIIKYWFLTKILRRTVPRPQLDGIDNSVHQDDLNAGVDAERQPVPPGDAVEIEENQNDEVREAAENHSNREEDQNVENQPIPPGDAEIRVQIEDENGENQDNNIIVINPPNRQNVEAEPDAEQPQFDEELTIRHDAIQVKPKRS